MAEDPQLAINKRKYDGGGNTPGAAAPRRVFGFSSGPISSSSPDSKGPAYNSVPPPADEFQIAKQRAQEIAARLFSDAEAKRPRVENGAGVDGGADKGFGTADYSHKPLGQSVASFQTGVSSAASYGGYGGYQSTNKKIDIPNRRVGAIIGKSGDTIKYLQMQSGAKIQVTRDMDADPYSDTRIVELTGTSDQISKAEQLIKDVLEEADSAGAPAGTEQFVMKVPNDKVGMVIGKGGDNIKNMQAASGARIQVIPLRLPPGDTSTERNVQINGTPEQIEAAKQLINDVTSENRSRNPTMTGGYTQQGYQPPRQQTSWGPPGAPPMQQQASYGYMQPMAYPGPPSEYNASQPPYNGYPSAPASTGYATGWDQSSNPQSQQYAAPGAGHDYYNQQQPPPSSAPGDAPAYNYSQHQASSYNTQASYGDASYSQPLVQQQGYGQDGYSGAYHAPTSQTGYPYPPPNTQSGYDQHQSYGDASAHSATQDGSAAAGYGAAGGSSAQGPPSQQAPPSVQPPTSQQSYAAQQPNNTAPPAYTSQGAPSGYGMPATSQPGYGGQLPPQAGYGQPAPLNPPPYSQPSAGQKPPSSAAPYGSTAPAGYAQPGPVQTGYGQPPPAQSAYPQGHQPGYGPQGHSGYGTAHHQQQQQPPYGDSYGAGGYAQPPGYSSGNGAVGSVNGASAAQSAGGVPAKASPPA